jgi:hypothetical protein
MKGGIMPGKDSCSCTLIDRFSFTQKLSMRAGWFGFMAVGTYAIAKQNPLWAWAYVAFGFFGFALVVLPSICAHCPYPTEFSTCLFLPPGVMRRFYPYRGPKISLVGKMASFLALAGMLIIPQFFLVHDLSWFVIFWLLGLPVVAAFPLYFCRGCRNSGCPMNQAPISP